MWSELVHHFPAPLPGDGFNLFKEKFHAERGHEWYLQAGAAAAVRSLQLAYLALRSAAYGQRDLVLTADIEAWSQRPRHILVWEAFLAGDFKPQYQDFLDEGTKKDRIDAWRAAELLLDD